MITLARGDILKADTEAIVNTVNCVGIMGRGIALQFKKAFPANFKYYEAACKREEVKPGSMLIYDTGSMVNPRYLVNFPTKRHWKGNSRIEDVRAGLEDLLRGIQRLNIKSIAIPPLGCGLGGLEWSDVLPLIKQILSPLGDSVDVVVYEPAGAPSADAIAKTKQMPNMTVGRAALVSLMRRYLAAVMDPTVTLLEIQKLMYFMQEAGELLNLDYKKASYGPYAQKLSHVLNLIEGHFISGYLDGGNAPEKPLNLIAGAIPAAEEFLSEHTETRARFDRVTSVIQGFETPYGMELLSTVHWVVTREGAKSPQLAAQRVHEWNDRKKMFTDQHIEIAFTALHQRGWIGTA